MMHTKSQPRSVVLRPPEVTTVDVSRGSVVGAKQTDEIAPDRTGLPPSWAQVTVGSVTITKVEQREPAGKGEFRYVDIASVDNQAKRIAEPKSIQVAKAPSRARQLIEHGDVLVSMTRPNLNAVALVPQQLNGAIASTGFDVLRSNGAVLPDWLFLLVRSRGFVQAMTDLVQGALYPAVRPADIRDFELPLPPLTEQRRIVSRMEKLEAHRCRALAALDDVPALLAQARQSLLAAAFCGDLTKNWRSKQSSKSLELPDIRASRRQMWLERQKAKYKAQDRTPPSDLDTRYEDPQPLTSTESEAIPHIPKPWAWQSMETAILHFRYGTSVKSSKTGQVPVLRMGNLQDGKIEWDGLVFTSNQNEISEYMLEAGSVLFNRTNSPELVGKAAIFQGERPAIFAGYLMHLEQVPGVDPRFLNYFLQSPYARHWCWFAKSDGVSQSNISGSTLARMPFPLAPVAEQNEITHRLHRALTRLDMAAAAHKAAVAELDRFDNSLLAQAFAGKLVPQNPNDEPASILLRRIKDQRPGAAEKPKQPSTPIPRPKTGASADFAQQVIDQFAEGVPITWGQLVTAFKRRPYPALRKAVEAALQREPMKGVARLTTRYNESAKRIEYIALQE